MKIELRLHFSDLAQRLTMKLDPREAPSAKLDGRQPRCEVSAPSAAHTSRKASFQMADAAEEAKLKAKYGALPNQKALLERRLKGDPSAAKKQYFDSADWARGLPGAATQAVAAQPPTSSASPLPGSDTELVAELPPAPRH